MSDANPTSNPSSSYSYDEVPYPSHPYQATHPDHIYSLARAFKFDAKIPDDSKVLELGCASGGNLVPMAVQIPSAKFIGVDLSSKQIGQGRATIESLGLKNIELLDINFDDINESFGQFDYILCHGVFSWVPLSAQKRILEICRDRLSPTGVAYISYNAYPGWFMRGMIREMMLHHIKNISDSKQKTAQARALLAFLVASTEGQTNPYAQCLKEELDLLSKHSDAYLFHDHLEENNHPMFFYQFMELAKENGLQFMSETNLSGMITSNLPPKAAEALTKLTNDVHHRSQYTDFVTNRMFRQSLLCRSDQVLNRHLDESRFEGARFVGNFQIDLSNGTMDLSPTVEVTFKCHNGRTIRTANAPLKAMMHELSVAFPASLSLTEISAKVEKRLSQTLVVGEQDQVRIPKFCASNLLQLIVRGDIDFRFPEDRFTVSVEERPRISGLSRLQAKVGGNVTTQLHGMIAPDPMTRLVMQILDGTRNRQDLSKYIADLVSSGKLKVNVQGEQKVEMAAVFDATVDKILEQMRRQGLLVHAGAGEEG